MKNLNFICLLFLLFPCAIWAQLSTPGGTVNSNTTNNVGIDVSNPSQKLEVAGNIKSTNSILWGTTGASLSTQQGAAIELRGTGTTFIDFSNDGTSDFDGRLMLRADNKMSLVGKGVDGSGLQLGIGTYQPKSQLDLRGSTGGEGGHGIFKISGHNGDSDANLRFGIVNGQYAWIQSHANRPLYINRVGNNTVLNKDAGIVGIGTSNLPNQPTTTGGTYRLFVKGGIKAEEIKIELCGSNWCDYVFHDDYELLPLSAVEAQIKENGHLHKIESAENIEKNGLELKSITINQQEKIEEIFLHLIEMEKQMNNLKTTVKVLKQENSELKEAMHTKK